MQKFTIFSVIFSVILLIVVAELLVNDYFNESESGEQFSASLFYDSDKDYLAEASDKMEGIVRDNIDDFTDSLPSVNPLSGKKHLTTEFLDKSGFDDPEIEEDEFKGMFLDVINLSDVGITDVIKGKIYENDTFSSVYFESRSENISTAKEVYTLIKEKAKGDIDINVNETDNYGDNSFYINHLIKKDQVFLVVRLRNYVYGFNYLPVDHNKFVDLVKIL